MIVEVNDDIEKNNIQDSLLLDHLANLLRNYNFFTSLLCHQPGLLTTNLGVGSSNLSGRARYFKDFTDISASSFWF